MNVLEGVAKIARRSVRRLTQETWEDRTLVVRISNGSNRTVEAQEPFMVAGCCAATFSQLLPGQTGTVRFSSAGGEFLGNATSGCHHAGALELRLGEERLLLAESCPLGHSTLKSHRFVMGFEAERSLQDFYNEMPAVFMGSRDAQHSMHQQGLCVRIHAVSTESPAVVDVVILQEELEQWEYDLDSSQQLDFAEWCLGHPQFEDYLGSAMFLAESQAVENAMRHKKMSRVDKASNLTLLIEAFVTTGLCHTSPEALGRNLSRWRSFPKPRDTRSDVSGQEEDVELQAYIDECHMLIRTTAVRCMLMLKPAVAECKAQEQWPAQALAAAAPRSSPRAVGRGSMLDFFRRSSTLEDPARARRSCCGTAGAVEGVEREQLLRLVRGCVHRGAEFTRRRSRVLDVLQAVPQGQGLARYRRHLALTHRSILEHRGANVVFNFFSPEVFEELGDAGVSPEEVLQSLGQCSPEYRTMSTNSKSGELFLFSSDRRFIIKTLSSKELSLLMRMMPAYLEHIQTWPRSLIVRYAGLYLLQRGEHCINFVVMRSVFDPLVELHAKYDLKGSLYKRRKKSGESVGKDEDWVSSGQRLRLAPEVQRELCAQHELDAQLLEGFKMMDYSLLIGVHFMEDGAKLGPGWHEGFLVSEDGLEVYYVGIIDHSIKYGLKKQAENLLRVAQGTSDRASCVSADTYAERQVQFLYQKVLASSSDVGTLGRLRVDVLKAEELMAADWNGASDPYVTVKLGLGVKHTATVPVNCNPEWNCSLFLPVHQAHEEQELKLSVWDEDNLKSLRGNDDFLGRLSVPMSWILKGPVDLRRAALEDVPQGRLSVRCLFEAAEDEPPLRASPKPRDVACCTCSPMNAL